MLGRFCNLNGLELKNQFPYMVCSWDVSVQFFNYYFYILAWLPSGCAYVCTA